MVYIVYGKEAGPLPPWVLTNENQQVVRFWVDEHRTLEKGFAPNCGLEEELSTAIASEKAGGAFEVAGCCPASIPAPTPNMRIVHPRGFERNQPLDVYDSRKGDFIQLPHLPIVVRNCGRCRDNVIAPYHLNGVAAYHEVSDWLHTLPDYVRALSLQSAKYYREHQRRVKKRAERELYASLRQPPTTFFASSVTTASGLDYTVGFETQARPFSPIAMPGKKEAADVVEENDVERS